MARFLSLSEEQHKALILEKDAARTRKGYGQLILLLIGLVND